MWFPLYHLHFLTEPVEQRYAEWASLGVDISHEATTDGDSVPSSEIVKHLSVICTDWTGKVTLSRSRA
jgi:hypothetical protein